MDKRKGTKMLSHIIGEIAISLGVSVITDVAKTINSATASIISVREWDETYNGINKMLYKLSPKQYEKHRAPSKNKNSYELTSGVRYIVKLKDNNFAMVETTREDNSKIFFEKSLHIRFIGKNRYLYRNAFLVESAKLTDKKCIPVKYLNEYGIQCDIIPRSFDSIVLEDSVRHNIVSGLQNWKTSRDWYETHQLVYKIGVFLYGDPGTGKSTITRAISEMFNRAPILVMDINNIMQSIRSIIKMRERYKGTIIVLIEDIDMYFPKQVDRTDNEQDNPDPNKEAEERTNKINQNAIFQLLDGVYSTDDTIYIATTNYKDKLDSALIRCGRFDIQERLSNLTEDGAKKKVQLLGYDASVLRELNIEYPVQPALLQSKIMEYRANRLKKEGE